MNDETLTPAQAIEEMRREGRRSQWRSNERIEQCIADYAKLHPRLAGFTIPPLPPPLRGTDRYLRQPPPPPQQAVDGSARAIAETLNSPELRGP